MKKSKNFLAFALAFAVIAATFVAPTFSWLSSQSEKVVNTFSGGAISVIIDEAPVDENGKKTQGDRVTANNYKYVAGSVLDKDPTPTILKGSDECYVYLCVENDLTDLFSLDIDSSSWVLVAQKDGKAVYMYKEAVDASHAENDVALNPIFTHVTVSKELTAEDVEKIGERTLCVTAYAVQTEALSVSEANSLAAVQFGLTEEDIL